MLSVSTSEPYAPCPAPFNMAAHVLQHAEACPDKVALAILRLSGAERWSYAKLTSAVLGTGMGLLSQGLEPGDRVLLRLGNSVDYPLAYLGAIAVGLVPVPTSPLLTEYEVKALLPTLAPKLILCAEGVACPPTEIPQLSLEDLRKMRDLPAASFHMGDPNRLAYIVYSSGTSGKPRAVAHAHRAIWARQMMFDGWYGLREDDRLMHAGAFNWTYTMGTGLMDPWTIGATALIPAEGTEPSQMALLLKRHDATLFAAVPGVFRKLLNAENTPELPKLRHGLVAGEKLSETLRQRWKDATETALHEAYGMSEISTFISANPTQPAAPDTLGRAQQGRQVAILDAKDPAPLGTAGTIAVHRSDPGLMLGYLDAPEETSKKMQGDWFLTGDQGFMDKHGNITFLGRTDDMMNAGGFRVSPLEVEAVLNAHPAIGQAAVTEIEVKEDAKVIYAFYTTDTDVPEGDLSAFVAERLAPYKCPRGFIRLDSLPTGANGKLLRRALRQIYEAKHGH